MLLLLDLSGTVYRQLLSGLEAPQKVKHMRCKDRAPVKSCSNFIDFRAVLGNVE